MPPVTIEKNKLFISIRVFKHSCEIGDSGVSVRSPFPKEDRILVSRQVGENVTILTVFYAGNVEKPIMSTVIPALVGCVEVLLDGSGVVCASPDTVCPVDTQF
jgi:hypothetical protein